MTRIELKIIDNLTKLGVSHIGSFQYDGAFYYEFEFQEITIKLKLEEIVFHYESFKLNEDTIIDRSVKEILLYLLNEKQIQKGFEHFYEQNI